MTLTSSDAMRRALQAVRAGRLGDATTLIQQSLGGQEGLGGQEAPARPAAAKARSPKPAAQPGRQRFSCDAGARDYLLHLPRDSSVPPRGLVLMLHGCTQTPEDFAIGTRMSAQAHAAGLAVIYAAQARGDNAQSCWNWFSRADQTRGRGEPAILSGMALAVAAEHGMPQGAIYVAGLSAGAAMAVILGRTYPEVFAAVGAHSGLPYGAAHTVPQAFAAMAGDSSARPVHSAATAARQVPTIVFHGSADATVAAVNGDHIITDSLSGTAQSIQTGAQGHTAGRSFERMVSHGPCGTALAEHWRIDGLGHAWSGGDPKGSYADAAGPDATAEMLRFFAATES